MNQRSDTEKNNVRPETWKPKWLIRIERTMKELFSDIDRLHKLKHMKTMKKEKLIAKYRLTDKNLQETIEICKQKLQAMKARRIRYLKANERKQQNKDFKFNRKKLFKEILGKGKTSDDVPDKDECERFWKNIWGTSVDDEFDDLLLRRVANKVKDNHKQEPCLITMAELTEQFRRTTNWIAAVIDGIHGFWIKNLTAFHNKILELMNRILNERMQIPTLLTTGRTVLIQKDQAKGNQAANYRPITCLPILWKTLTGILAGKVYKHLEVNNLIPEMQKGCIRRSRATKDQLIIDQQILKDAKTRKKNLSMCWIDYQKAYDMVPHSWILKVMRAYGIADNIVEVIATTMKEWNVWLYHKKERLCNIAIKRGIFQGDALSPIMFIMTLFPLSHVTLNNQMGYLMKTDNINSDPNMAVNKVRINHLLYMDDIKLYAQSEEQLHRLVDAVKGYSDTMKMRFGLDKCKIVNVSHGKLSTSSDAYEMDKGEKIEALVRESDSYKYLGILQLNDMKNEEMKTKVEQEYTKRVRAILKTQLYAKNKIQAINSLAIPVIKYTGYILQWTKAELQQLDRQTRKLLTMYRGLSKRADVDRIYTKRIDGGRGLVSVEEAIMVEEASVERYRQKSKQNVIHIRLCEAEGKNIKDLKDSIQRQRRDGWGSKRMHGEYMRRLEEGIDINQTFQWLVNGQLSIETEGMLTAAQDQAIQTRAIAKRIYGIGTTDKCRLCDKAVETVMHVLAECSQIAQSEYLVRHNQVARYVHWRLLENHGFIVDGQQWFQHEPTAVVENENAKILWDFNIYTDHVITARRPDIVVLDKASHSGLIIDINCPNDANVCKNEKEKRQKYTELKIELERLWEMHLEIVPIVVGCLGAVSKNLGSCLTRIGLTAKEEQKLQEITLLASARILRRCVTQAGTPL